MTKTFTSELEFEAMRQAEDWLLENGYAVGSMQRDAPRGILKDADSYVPKWRSLDYAERENLDGQMTGDMRGGPVVVEIFE